MGTLDEVKQETQRQGDAGWRFSPFLLSQVRGAQKGPQVDLPSLEKALDFGQRIGTELEGEAFRS